MNDSYIHPALVERLISTKGVGVFTKIFIPKGTIIGIAAGGKIIPGTQIETVWKSSLGDHTHQVEDNFHWAPLNPEDVNLLDNLNHSCDPNVAISGDMSFVTLRDIQPENDELCWDYATTESQPSYGFPCSCSAQICRGKVTGDDWMRLDVQLHHYPDHFSPYLQRKVRRSLEEQHLAIENGELFFVDTCDPRHRFYHKIEKVLIDYQSQHQRIQIFQTPYRPLLVLDGFPQLGVRDHDIYTEAIAGVSLIIHPNPRRVLIVGGGDGDALRLVTLDPRVKEIYLVDIDKDVIQLTQEHIPEFWGEAAHDSRVTIVTSVDALEFLRNNDKPFDIIISDLTDFDEGTASSHLFGDEFFKELRRNCETEDGFGLLMIQAGECTQEVYTGHQEIKRRVSQHFTCASPRSIVFYVPSFGTNWSGVIATTGNSWSFRKYDLQQILALFEERKIRESLTYLDALTFCKLFMLDPAVHKKLATL